MRAIWQKSGRTPPWLGEWLTITEIECYDGPGYVNRWVCYAKSDRFEIRIGAYPEHRNAVQDAGYDITEWPKYPDRRRLKVSPIEVRIGWHNKLGLTIAEVEPAAQAAAAR